MTDSFTPEFAAHEKAALFLDRDGVINVDHGYVHRPDQIEFLDGIFDLCRTAKSRGYLIVVVTNQAGIGRGYYSEEEFHALMGWMQQRFTEENCSIDKVYFCPDHPEHGVGPYKRDSWHRKPNPGMLEDAIRELSITPEHSILIGDKISDMQAGQAVGIRWCMLLSASEPYSGIRIDSLKAVFPILDAQQEPAVS